MPWRIACCIGGGLLASTAQAQMPGRPVPTVQPADTSPTPMLSETELGASRAGQSIVTGTQTLNATTTGNTVNGNLVAGSLTLSDNALANFSGVGNFAFNSGSQVSIQSAMNLTINVTY